MEDDTRMETTTREIRSRLPQGIDKSTDTFLPLSDFHLPNTDLNPFGLPEGKYYAPIDSSKADFVEWVSGQPSNQDGSRKVEGNFGVYIPGKDDEGNPTALVVKSAVLENITTKRFLRPKIVSPRITSVVVQGHSTSETKVMPVHGKEMIIIVKHPN